MNDSIDRTATETVKYNENAFDLLRLILAIFVVITHGYLIGGYGVNDPIEKIMNFKSSFSLGTVGVMGFFSLSGYLITASFERSQSPLIFIYHRLFRIIPGFWACLVVTAFIISPTIYLINNQTLSGFYWQQSLSYIWNNILVNIRQWNIGNTLEISAYKESINGSLWSLFPEIVCYTFTLLGGILGIFKNNKVLLLLFFLYFFALFVVKTSGLNEGPTIIMLNDIGRLQAYTSYICGSILYVFRKNIKIDIKGVLFVLILAILSLRFGGYERISPILISLIIIYGFQAFTFKIRYDLSYGIYIYSFPLQQLLYVIFGNSLPVLVYLFLSILVSCILAFFSFKFIEMPFMKLRKQIDKKIKSFI
ncbi:acyltransferase [Pseudanabaena sp. FACHB-1998]|uniref:acyltransferase family protein n=1 Tax=Pseudanabaena sp. FACHB-1998 TaxID=2692858 RepID=UPI001680C01E|nr:acyltransferase [Pseudanabaena sp. FACHB-1998]MBD2176624.1 acyltransferase [Pseudanabaena sp. FACHB-1998]